MFRLKNQINSKFLLEVIDMDPLLLRFFERLTVVLLGGMAIYLGFRLFLEVPEHKDGAGKFVLPWDISIVMTRIGPGVFFALFGVIAVSLALIRPLEIGSQAPSNFENPGNQARLRYATNIAYADKSARHDARSSLRKEIATLNTITGALQKDLPKFERDEFERRIRHIKLALMKPVWGETDEGFGEFSEFERWIKEGEPEPPPAGMKGALELYRYGQKE